MTKHSIIIISLSLFSLTSLPGQDLALFNLFQMEIGKDTTAFVSLSDIDRLSENLDSLAIPDLSEKSDGDAKESEYFILESTYRNQFLLRTNISENDKVFIFSYEKNILISVPVKNLKVVAHLNPYGADWPYRQEDFMIGFEIDKKQLAGLEKYFVNTLVYIGKKNPFVLNQLNPVVWKLIDSKEFPSRDINPKDTARFNHKHKDTMVDYNSVISYKFVTQELQYFLQDTEKNNGNGIWAKRLLVINSKTKETVFEKIFYESESSTYAPLDNQWTGKLFKNKPAVVFGFKWVSFGCPEISFLSPTEKDIYIHCDNRH